MDKVHDNAMLQHRILLSLKTEPASSIAVLARRLDVHRPSASRALHSLKDAGHVARSGKVWMLTEEGLRESERLSASVAEKTARKGVALSRLIEKASITGVLDTELLATTFAKIASADALRMGLAGVAKNLPDEYSLGLAGIVKHLDSANSLLMSAMPRAFDNSPMRLATQAFDSTPMSLMDALRVPESFTPRLVEMSMKLGGAAAKEFEGLRESMKLGGVAAKEFEGLRESMRALSEAQTTSLKYLAEPDWRLSAGFTRVLAENNKGISQMLADVSALNTVSLRDDYARLAEEAFQTIKAHRSQFIDAARTLANRERDYSTWTSQIGAALSRDIIVPTATTSRFVHSVRGIVELQSLGAACDDAAIAAALEDRHYSERQALPVDEILVGLGEPFARRWRGAWDTLYSSSPDRLSQATHSARELLMQVLDYLAPDSVFADEEIRREGKNGHPTKRMRVRWALRSVSSEKSVAWADKVADALCVTYDVLAAESHSRAERFRYGEEQMAGLLMTLGGLLKFIILSRQSND